MAPEKRTKEMYVETRSWWCCLMWALAKSFGDRKLGKILTGQSECSWSKFVLHGSWKELTAADLILSENELLQKRFH